jgi:molybdopterin-guanine dinucleotide biosynthesis protein A
MSGDVAVAILAGGEGRRIGGAKPLRIFAGERLIDRALRQARAWSDIVAVAVREPAQVGPLDVPLLDDEPAMAGPLGGLVAGLRFARDAGRPFLLAIPADVPFLPPDLLVRLAQAIAEHGCALAASGGQLHPACGLWRVATLARVPDYAATGKRSLKGFAEQVGFASVEWPGGAKDPFFNVNTAADLAAAERRLAG